MSRRNLPSLRISHSGTSTEDFMLYTSEDSTHVFVTLGMVFPDLQSRDVYAVQIELQRLGTAGVWNTIGTRSVQIGRRGAGYRHQQNVEWGNIGQFGQQMQTRLTIRRGVLVGGVPRISPQTPIVRIGQTWIR